MFSDMASNTGEDGTNFEISIQEKLRENKIINKIHIVDDNSSVRSKLIINFIKNKFSNIYVLTNNKNLGQGGSIKKAYKNLKKSNDLICTMDDDGQHDTKDVKKILNNFYIDCI